MGKRQRKRRKVKRKRKKKRKNTESKIAQNEKTSFRKDQERRGEWEKKALRKFLKK